MGEPKLAYTVHHKGRIHSAGSTSTDIGPDAADIGAHAWEGGIAPEPEQVPPPEAPPGGNLLGTPPLRSSALPTPPEPPATSGETPAEEPPAEAKKATSGARRGGTQTAS